MKGKNGKYAVYDPDFHNVRSLFLPSLEAEIKMEISLGYMVSDIALTRK